jgi:hypothetical protein
MTGAIHQRQPSPRDVQSILGATGVFGALRAFARAGGITMVRANRGAAQ